MDFQSKLSTTKILSSLKAEFPLDVPIDTEIQQFVNLTTQAIHDLRIFEEDLYILLYNYTNNEKKGYDTQTQFFKNYFNYLIAFYQIAEDVAYYEGKDVWNKAAEEFYEQTTKLAEQLQHFYFAKLEAFYCESEVFQAEIIYISDTKSLITYDTSLLIQLMSCFVQGMVDSGKRIFCKCVVNRIRREFVLGKLLLPTLTTDHQLNIEAVMISSLEDQRSADQYCSIFTDRLTKFKAAISEFQIEGVIFEILDLYYQRISRDLKATDNIQKYTTFSNAILDARNEFASALNRPLIENKRILEIIPESESRETKTSSISQTNFIWEAFKHYFSGQSSASELYTNTTKILTEVERGESLEDFNECLKCLVFNLNRLQRLCEGKGQSELTKIMSLTQWLEDYYFRCAGIQHFSMSQLESTEAGNYCALLNIKIWDMFLDSVRRMHN